MSAKLPSVILGALILAPRLLEMSDVSDYDLPVGRMREAFKNVVTIWEEQRPDEIDAVLLSERIGGDGAYSFVSSLLSGAIKLNPEAFQARVNELRRKALTVRILKKIEKQVKIGKLDLDEVEPDLLRYRALSDPKLDISTSLKKGSELQTLDLHVEWFIEKLIPERSVTLLHGKGGLGKTWLCLQIAKAIAEGQEFLSLKTKTRSVIYIDLENSLPLLIERIRKIDIRDVLFWHLSEDPRPPKLDSKNYIKYKKFAPESLLIFDTLRAAHDGDENSSKDMAFVMGRLKELRELGFTILLNHHTGKADERIYKGSTAISDLADHVLSLHRVKRSTFEEVEDDAGPGPDDYFYLGTKEKTRYEPFHIFLKFSPESGFVRAEDPDQESLEAISEFIKNSDHTLNQTEIFNWAKMELEIKKKAKLSSILKKGEKLKLWISRKEGYRRLYESL